MLSNKKRSMAIVMAGATVMSAAAPIFADNTVTENVDKNYTVSAKDSAKLIEEVRKALEVKFEDTKAGANVNDRVYDIKVDNVNLTNATQLQNKINSLTEGQSLKVTIQDKGHQVLGGKVVDYKIENYKTAQEIVDAVNAYNATLAEDSDNKLTATIKSTNTVEVKRAKDSANVITLNVGDQHLDFSKVITSEEGTFEGYEKSYSDIGSKELHTITVKNADLQDISAEELFDGIRLTTLGREIVNKVKNGYALTFENEAILTQEQEDSDDKDKPEKSSFDIVLSKANEKPETISVSSKNHKLVRDLHKVLTDVKDGKELKVEVLSGDSRFTTAVEVSKERFKDGEAEAIILVGEDAIVDGLASAPLASQKNAPILLSKKDSLPSEIEAEILRVLGSNLSSKKIYIVGGESKVSKETEEKLSKLGVSKVERVSGEDRFETSLEIAKQLKDTFKTAFVVGGNGEADAMSISARAAQFGAPIIVTGNELDANAEKLLKGKELEIVGGENSVSKEVEDKLVDIDLNNKVERLAGENRKDTNAKVINKYYAGATKAYVAKDGYVGGNGQLVDALTAAPLAASSKAPIVLTTEELSKSQEEVVELRLKNATKLVQIGEGIAKNAIEKIAEKINLFTKN
ncbi:TPA: cell wall-binding protein Cwp8 [Clostridioides difficile]|nr:cell wall-binding protein Cwp8 [Clostridioides difficile]HBG5378243.1 cell wall-binding protein Cwp8 [Clostridioides difficile]HBG5512563.1 cell wall-binding protein Cwp8 [Clostridioides difficile]HBY2768969.1 cell wall-binding protein Cwp8 [Clostridioides difficile]HBY2876347.1 cell wall-binding protein Cwp8 [Clostridioides difficile]